MWPKVLVSLACVYTITSRRSLDNTHLYNFLLKFVLIQVHVYATIYCVLVNKQLATSPDSSRYTLSLPYGNITTKIKFQESEVATIPKYRPWKQFIYCCCINGTFLCYVKTMKLYFKRSIQVTRLAAKAKHICSTCWKRAVNITNYV